jgi:GTP-binding protein YchF
VKIGLVGLPRSGKTSLFNLLTGSSVPTSSFGSPRGQMHVGIARVPDERVDRLSALFSPRKTTCASFEVVDLAGISKGDRQGLEAREFRNADALLHVVRAFPDMAGAPATPPGDIEDLDTELMLADLEVVERRLERLEASIRKRRTDVEVKEQEILRQLASALGADTPIRALDLSADQKKAIRGFTFLSQKPILHVLNLAEKDIAFGAMAADRFGLTAVTAAAPGTRIGWVSAVIEAEVGQLAGVEQVAFLADLGLAEPAIKRLLRDCYALLGLISFFTVGEDEVRAWPIRRGTRAQDAADTIHSDIARRFIRAEVVSYADLVAASGEMAVARERGQLRLEGKDYIVQDGEICHFRFSPAR